MKYLFMALCLISASYSFAQVGIGTSTPAASSKLDISAIDKGFLVPRMTSSQRTSITSPAVGLLVYQTDGLSGFYYHNGSEWASFGYTASNYPSTNGNSYWGLYAGTTATYHNAGFGYEALSSNTGYQNTGIGYRALYNNYSGYQNTAVGNQAGIWNGAGYRNTFIGTEADAQNSGSLINATAIGYAAKVGASNTIQLGNASITSVITSGTITANGLTLTSDARLKTNIESISNGLKMVLQLQPYHYEKKSDLANTTFDLKEFGFLAQDVQNLLPELVLTGTDKDKTLSVNYVALIPILTKAIQEQQQEIEQLKK